MKHLISQLQVVVRTGLFIMLALHAQLAFGAEAFIPKIFGSSPDNITTNSADVIVIVNPSGAATNVWFEYGKTTALGQTIGNQQIGSGTSDVKVTTFLSGLEPNTMYYYRVMAQNAMGTVQGSILNILTRRGASSETTSNSGSSGSGTNQGTSSSPSQGLPIVVTNAAANIGNNSAEMKGSVNSQGTTNVWFEYGLSQNLGASAGTKSTSLNGETPISVVLNGLKSGTTYYYRLAAQNSFGVHRGSILSMKTTGAVLGTTNTGGTNNTGSNSGSNNTSTGGTSSVTKGLVTLTSMVDKNAANPGEEITYKVIYKNNATVAVENAVLTIVMPLQATYVSSNPAFTSRTENNVIFNLGTIKAKTEGEVIVKAKVKDPAEPVGPIVFTALLDYAGQSQANGLVSSQIAAGTADGSGLAVEEESGGLLANIGSFFGRIPDYLWFIIVALVLTFTYFFIQYMRHDDELDLDDEDGFQLTPAPVSHH